MGSIAPPSPALPDLQSLVALFPPDPKAPEYSVAYIYAGVSLLALGAEQRIPDLWQQITHQHAASPAALATAATRLREGLVKASPLVGFPRAINALTALQSAITESVPATVSALLYPSAPAPAPPPSSPKPNPLLRGHSLWTSTYGPHASRVRSNLDTISGHALGAFATECIYGTLLADERVLSAKEAAGVVFVACLAAGAGPQAKGHMYGARNLGNAGGEVRGMVGVVKELGGVVGGEGMGWVEVCEEW